MHRTAANTAPLSEERKESARKKVKTGQENNN